MAVGSKIGEAYVELHAKMAKFESELKSARVLTEKSVNKMQAKFQALAPTFRKVGIGMAAAGGAITAALGLAIKSSIDFNKEIANIATLIPRSTERVNELKGAIRTMAVEVGKDTADLAQGAYQVISAFGDTADTVDILKMSAKAATAGVATTTEAINLLSAVTKGYGDTSKEAVKKASDLAFQTVTLGQTAFPELAASIGKAIPLAAKLGVEEEELFAVMATATGVTGKAAEVSTQLRGIFQSLMAPTKDMAELIADMGYKSGEAMLKEKGLSGALKIVTEAAEKSGIPLQKYISQIEGQTLALALTGAQSDVYTEKLAKMRDSIGLTDVAFKEQTEGINKAGFAFQQAKIQIEVLAQEIGDRLLPMIVPLIKKVTDIVKAMSEWSKEHPKLTSILIKFAAVLGPLLIALGGLLMILPGLVAIAPAVGAAFHIMLGPIGLITGAIAAATVAFVYFYKKNETFRKGVQKTGAYLEFFGKVVAGVFKAVGANIGNFLGWFSVEFPNVFRDVASAAGRILKNLGGNIGKWAIYIGKKLNPKNWLKEIEAPDWTPLLEGFEATVTEIPKLIGVNLDEAKGILEKKLTAIGVAAAETVIPPPVIAPIEPPPIPPIIPPVDTKPAKRAYLELTEAEKKWYEEREGQIVDFTKFTKEEVEKLKKAYKEYWEGVVEASKEAIKKIENEYFRLTHTEKEQLDKRWEAEKVRIEATAKLAGEEINLTEILTKAKFNLYKDYYDKIGKAQVDYQKEMASLFGNETKLLEIEIEARKKAYKKAGWSNKQIADWETAYRKKKKKEELEIIKATLDKEKKLTQKIKNEIEDIEFNATHTKQQILDRGWKQQEALLKEEKASTKRIAAAKVLYYKKAAIEEEKIRKKLLDSLTKDQKKYYEDYKKQTIDWGNLTIEQIEAIIEELEGLAKAGENAVERLETAWKDFCSSLKSSFASVVEDWLQKTITAKEAFQELGRVINESVTAAIANLIAQKLSEWVIGFAKAIWEQGIPALIKLIAKIWEAVVATLAWIATGIITFVQSLTKAVAGLTTSLVVLLGKIALLIAAFLAAWESMKRLWELITEKIIPAFKEFYESVKKVKDELGGGWKWPWDWLWWANQASTATENLTAEVYTLKRAIEDIPRRVDFDVIGNLHMPNIPDIGNRYFNIIGRYGTEGSIPRAQIGIPYIPRTMPVIVHPKEAILTASQAREWRAGRGESGAKIEQNVGPINITAEFPNVDLETLTQEKIERVFQKKFVPAIKESVRMGIFSRDLVGVRKAK